MRELCWLRQRTAHNWVSPSLHLSHNKHITTVCQAAAHPLLDDLFSTTSLVSQHRKGYTNLDFNEARDDGVAMASAGPYANHVHLAPDRQPREHLITQFFTDRMLFLMPKQQCQSTEGKPSLVSLGQKKITSSRPQELFISKAAAIHGAISDLYRWQCEDASQVAHTQVKVHHLQHRITATLSRKTWQNRISENPVTFIHCYADSLSVSSF